MICTPCPHAPKLRAIDLNGLTPRLIDCPPYRSENDLLALCKCGTRHIHSHSPGDQCVRADQNANAEITVAAGLPDAPVPPITQIMATVEHAHNVPLEALQAPATA